MPIQLSNGTISINGMPMVIPPSFATHIEILELFGIRYKRHFESYYQLPGDILIWFPRIRHIGHGVRYVLHGNEIEEDCSASASPLTVRDLLVRNHQRITFIQFGKRYYYAGVYVYDHSVGKNIQLYSKVADSVRLDSRIL